MRVWINMIHQCHSGKPELATADQHSRMFTKAIKNDQGEAQGVLQQMIWPPQSPDTNITKTESGITRTLRQTSCDNRPAIIPGNTVSSYLKSVRTVAAAPPVPVIIASVSAAGCSFSLWTAGQAAANDEPTEAQQSHCSGSLWMKFFTYVKLVFSSLHLSIWVTSLPWHFSFTMILCYSFLIGFLLKAGKSWQLCNIQICSRIKYKKLITFDWWIFLPWIALSSALSLNALEILQTKSKMLENFSSSTVHSEGLLHQNTQTESCSVRRLPADCV